MVCLEAVERSLWEVCREEGVGFTHKAESTVQGKRAEAGLDPIMPLCPAATREVGAEDFAAIKVNKSVPNGLSESPIITAAVGRET